MTFYNTYHMQAYAVRQRKILFSGLLLIGLAACGGKETEKPMGQIVAKVNSGEISVHQINHLLARVGTNAANANTAEKVSQLRRGVLDRLIDQELAVEKAIEKKLDRSPEVLMAIENARREILARAYLEQVTAGLAKPTVEEAKKYYSEHPQLFAERRIYNIQEIAIPATAGVTSELRELLNGGKSLEDIASWLKSKDIKFGGGSVTRPAEQLPLELLPKIHPLKVGQGLMVEGPQSITIMRLAAAQSAPVTEEIALPRIQQFLGNQLATEAVKQELKTLRSGAHITYLGEFSDTDVKVDSEAVSIQTPDSKNIQPPVGNNNAGSAPVIDATLEKGVAGLK
ncbi:EpsD family peptidyl-prolyl cis-trans isomerase [Nitrosovibrio sp. Nv17]|uniref:EpsD family peptidyl-prolyl cis-trans isomerase n=1 Tax=Nitrosovibrio sp. Nv17 TaxID=1855339 RepID=UPI000908C962|nr:EpsD family peptidyl-prolyl cis-trans isomerase [Nitrosovibrio sp. Nv17]SFW39967.1 peptidyl-prolyl cis-trans isomerase, EpsD family [Nitrosovibrio sp. Nv17]